MAFRPLLPRASNRVSYSLPLADAAPNPIKAWVRLQQGDLVIKVNDAQTSHPDFVAVDGIDVTHWPMYRRVRKGLVRSFQVTSIFSQLTAIDNALLAAQAPWWAPGAASGYHGLTFGHLIGEVIRRVTGLRLGDC